MKALVLMAAVASLAISPAAFADTSTDNTNINTDIASVCKVTSGASDVTLHTTVNDSGSHIGQISNASFDLLGNTMHVFCNTAGSQIAISRTKLTNQDVSTISAASQALGFTRELDYSAELTGNTENGLKTINSQGFIFPSSTTYGVYASDLTLSVAGIQLLNWNKMPVAGHYQGVVTVTLSAS